MIIKDMQGSKNPIVRVFAYTIFMTAITIIIALRFKYIDMPDGRLFLEFWYAWLGCGSAITLSAVLLMGMKRR